MSRSPPRSRPWRFSDREPREPILGTRGREFSAGRSSPCRPSSSQAVEAGIHRRPSPGESRRGRPPRMPLTPALVTAACSPSRTSQSRGVSEDGGFSPGLFKRAIARRQLGVWEDALPAEPSTRSRGHARLPIDMWTAPTGRLHMIPAPPISASASATRPRGERRSCLPPRPVRRPAGPGAHHFSRDGHQFAVKRPSRAGASGRTAKAEEICNPSCGR